MANEAQDRNLPATERKIRKARSEGQVARSRDLSHFTALATVGALLVAATPTVSVRLRALLASGLHFDARFIERPDAMVERLVELGLWLPLLALPLGLCILLASLASALAAGGWSFTFKPLTPKFGKLNPLSGLAQLLSPARLGDTLKSCVLALVLGVIGSYYLRARLGSFSDAMAMPLPAALAQVGRTLLDGLMLLVIALAAFAAVDLPLQRALWRKRLKMSREEMKQELKELEGNVEVKAKVKARMREFAKRRMLTQVPKADLVVMNPTHYAVALKYDEATMAAPRVLAKGADLLALRIRDIARDAKVPVLRSPPLARALYAHVEIDREIPAQLFSAVAQVLAWVYQLRAAMAGRGVMPADEPQIELPAGLDPHEALAQA
jgi:flagellar biosynthetic protein FlhB